MRALRHNLLGLFLVMGSTVGAAHGLELCIALDGSGSIGTTDFTLQVEGLAQAVENPQVIPPNGSVTLSVVQFAGSTTGIEVAPTLIDSSTVADTVAAQIRTITQDSGGTPMDAAINVCTDQGLPFAAGQRQVIDVSTDGGPNSPSATLAAANAAVSAGVDAINGMGIGTGANISFLETMVRPQPASDPQPGAQGFVIAIEQFDEFADAIALKISLELGGAGVPAPALGGLALLATFGALTFAGTRRLRRSRRK
jgi:hypothetical protein